MLGRRKRKTEDFSEELKAHLALEIDQLRKEGLSPQEAEAAAHRRLGNMVQREEQYYESTVWIWLEQFRKDIAYALRQLVHNKGFTAVAVLTLALGIGANTAVFTLVNAVMLRSLPVSNPQELYRLGDSGNCCVIGGTQGRFSIYSYDLYLHLRDQTLEFQEMAAFLAEPWQLSFRRGGLSSPSEPMSTELVSGNYFAMLGVHAAAGRVITPSDDSASAAPVAMLSYRAWQQKYAQDPSVIGSSILLNGVGCTIVGVAPAGFFGDTLRADPPDVWAPLSIEPAVNGQNALLKRADAHWLYIIGRLLPGANISQIETKVNLELQQWFMARAGSKVSAKERDAIARQHITLAPAAGGVGHMQREYAAGLRLLMTVSGLVLLIACANMANLLLARQTAGRVQASIRTALGAPRHRLVRQTLVESVLLSLLGGAAGLFVAYSGTSAILFIAFRGANFVPIYAEPSAQVLGFAMLLSVITGIVFGAAPAWISARFEPADVLRGASRSTGNRSTLPQRSLVIFQAAVSLVLLAYAGLLTSSLRNLEHQQFGFETGGRVMVAVNPAFTGYSPERLRASYERLEQRLASVPGVVSASLALYSPMEGENWSSEIQLAGRPAGSDTGSSWDRVSAHYFETIGTRLVSGRAIDERDSPGAPFVAVVNQTFAKKFFANQDPLGKRFGFATPNDYQIVGIVEDAKYLDARDSAWPTFFLPLLQMNAKDWAESGMARSNFVRAIQLRVARAPSELEPRIRQAIAETDSNLTVLKVRSFADQLATNFNQERLLARLTALFGLLALIVASVGLYGITSYAVVRRTSEIGIRIALGASRTDVVRMVLRNSMLQTAIGLAIGVVAALAGAKVLANILYGVTGTDPIILAGATVILGACGAIAGLIPALRAAGIDPIQALRTE